MIRNKPKRMPFKGGISKVSERAVQHGQFSDKVNVRNTIPYGFEQRLGLTRLHTTTDSAQEIMSAYQFVDRGGTKRFFAQRADGSVHMATTAPPDVTTGNFGTEVLGTVSNALAGSWAIVNDYLLFRDGKRLPQIYTGTGQRISGFHVYKGTAIPATPKTILDVGEDYTDEVTDSVTTRVGILDSLSTLANSDALYICTDVPCNSLVFTMKYANGNASNLTVKYCKNDSTWASLSGSLTDGTSTGGASLGQSGTISWTLPTDEIPCYQFGRSGFWYQLSFSSALDAEVEVTQVTYSAPFQAIQDVWDGILVDAVQGMVYRDLNQKYEIYGSNAINCSELFNDADDYAYFFTYDNISGFYVDASLAPNLVKAVASGVNLRAVDGGAGVRDYYETFNDDFSVQGFEAGMNITVTGFPTAGNNISDKPIYSVSSTRITVDTALLTSENGDADSTITFDNTPVTISAVEGWTGANWTAVSNAVEGTAGLSKSGFVTFDRLTTAQRTQKVTGGSTEPVTLPTYLYAWRFKCDKATSKNVSIGIQVMPFFDISDWGYGMAVEAWKGRACYSFDKHGKEVKITMIDKPMVLHGMDAGIVEVGDGRENKVLCMKAFANELLVWQEEEGVEGGCTTLIEGYTPTTWGKLVLSTEIGILNAKSAVVLEGVLSSTKTNDRVQRLAYWLSRNGLFITEGMTVSNVSDPVQNYFDPTNSDCIRRTYNDKNYLGYDSAYNVLRLGLASGSSATTANIFLIYDLATRDFGTDTYPINLTCYQNIDANSGNVEVIQVAGGADGFLYLLNTGTNDVTGSLPTTTPVNMYCVFEVDGQGGKVDINTMNVRCKTQSAGSITLTRANNGNTTYSSFTDPTTIDMTVTGRTANDSYVYRDLTVDRTLEDHISIKFAHNTAGEACHLLDIAMLDIAGKDVFES